MVPRIDMRLGVPLAPLARRVADLVTGAGRYARTYRNGIAIASACGESHAYEFARTRCLVEPYGGGALSADATRAATVCGPAPSAAP